jgi:hypothetical protein
MVLELAAYRLVVVWLIAAGVGVRCVTLLALFKELGWQF